MTKTEINVFRRALEDSADRAGKRKHGIARPSRSRRVRMNWTESSTPASAITRWAISSVLPTGCAKCEPRFCRIEEGTYGICVGCEDEHPSEAPYGSPVDFILHRVPGGCGSRAGNIRG